MRTLYKHPNHKQVKDMAEALMTRGYNVSRVIVPEQWGAPAYFYTDATVEEVTTITKVWN